MRTQKVLLHNLSIEYTQPSTGLFDFDQNALFFAESEDIVVTRKKISDEYLTFLAQCGLDFAKVHFVHSELDIPSIDGIFFDKKSIKKVKSLLDTKRKSQLDSFILTAREVEWANAVSVAFEGSPEQEVFGGKSYFRSVAKMNKFQVAFGFENQNGVIDGAIKACLIFIKGFTEIVVKYDEGSVSLDSYRFSKDDFLKNFSRFEQILSSSFLRRVTPKFSNNFAIEGWYKNVVLSPSIQLYIASNGGVEVVSTHIQLLYDDMMQYKGCLSANYIDSDIREQVIDEGRALAAVFAKRGYRGNIAFDAIVLPKNKIIWEELNPRKTMTSYSFQIAKRLFGEKLVQSKFYVSQYVQKAAWKGKTIEELLVLLTPVLFSVKRGSGILPFNYGLLGSEGRISLLAFADTKNAAHQFIAYIDSL